MSSLCFVAPRAEGKVATRKSIARAVTLITGSISIAVAGWPDPSGAEGLNDVAPCAGRNYSLEESRFISRAEKLWTDTDGGIHQKAMRDRHPVVLTMGEEMCVGLQLRGGLGGEPVYCFSRKTKRLTKRYDDVE
jgi:hypothetical protein